jgi:hypothetical protein
MRQYQVEERSLIARRLQVEHQRLDALFKAMKAQPLSSEIKIAQLREGLNEHHQSNVFRACQNMGDLVEANLRFILSNNP